MKVHGNARLLPRQRMLMCRRVRLEGWNVAQVAEAFDVSERTVYRWLARFDAGAVPARPVVGTEVPPTRTPREVEMLFEQLRRTRWTAPRIAAELGMPTRRCAPCSSASG